MRFFCVCPCGAPNCNSIYHQDLLAGRESGAWDLADARNREDRPILTFVDNQPVWVDTAPDHSEGVACGLAARLEPGHFRLLRILPAESKGQDDHVRCVVSNFKLPGTKSADESADETPPYVAISYCWGEDPSLTRITVSDEHVDVRANLYHLLVKLRALGYQDWLWLDALCIRQADDLEKSHQIPLMGTIFEGAMLTLGYLGEDLGRFSMSMDRWKSCVSEVRRWYVRAVPLGYSSLAVERDQVKPLVLDEKFARYLIYIFGNPYWKRLWILQETVLPQYLLLLCNDHLFDWEDLHILAGYVHHSSFLNPVKNCSAISRSAQLSSQTLQYLGELRALYHGAFQHDTVPYIASLLQHARSRKSSYEADHVNGILGLLCQKHRDAFKVDVTKSTAQTFIHFTASLLETYGWTSVDLLRRTGLREYNPKRLPSWTINFARPSPTVSLRALSQPTFQVGTLRPVFGYQNIDIDTERGRLTVTGSRCDVISMVIPFKSQRQHFSKDVTICAAVYEALSTCRTAIAAVHKSEKDSTLALASTLSAAGFVGSADHMNKYNAWVQQMQNHMAGQDTNAVACTEFALNEFGIGIAQACRGRSFFTTTGGRIGLCPNLAEKGDHIVMICGCSTLMTLRVHDSGEFSLLGEVFCDGLNFGELEGEFQNPGWEPRKFVLI